MRKKYTSPRVDVIKTRLESEILAGSNIGSSIDEGNNAKTHDFDLDDLTDESMRGDETGGSN